jgi:hypothetical protein
VQSIPSLPPVLQSGFTTVATDAARATGFIQRQGKVTGPLFVQTLVFGWLRNPQATLENLAQTAALVGLPISPQGLAERFSPASAACLERVVQAAVEQVVAAQPVPIPLLQRFTAVTIRDSTTLRLPDELAAVWRGNGGNGPRHTQAAVKLQLRLDLLTGRVDGPILQDGRAQDRTSPFQGAPVAPGSLHLADLGYFSLDALARLAHQGAFWLTRLATQTALFTPAGQQLDLLRHLRAAGATLDEPILLGARHRLACRLLAVRVPREVADQRRRRMREAARIQGKTVSAERLALASWTIAVTNVPPDQLSLDEALVLLRARWQIELLVKRWKTDGGVRQSRSRKPWRILTEVYAKLLAGIIQHWLLLAGSWLFPNRSLVKAAQTVRAFAVSLALAVSGSLPSLAVGQVHAALTRTLAAGCKMNRRRKKPNTYQLLLDPTLGRYPALA